MFPEHKQPNIPNAHDTAAAGLSTTEQSSCTWDILLLRLLVGECDAQEGGGMGASIVLRP